MTDKQPGGHESSLPEDVASADGLTDAPLDAWMLALAHDVSRDDDDTHVDVPRELMWKRIAARRHTSTEMPSGRSARWTQWRGVAAIAAVLLAGVGIGRYALPRPAASVQVATARADSLSAPARVAMQEHLVRTVSLLTAVRDRKATEGPVPDVSAWARELLSTTRLLLDDPSLRDDRTRRLLQDLELVLMQIMQARGTDAPEAQRAPTETMRETNLLPRVRAVMSATARRDDLTVYGDDE